jgi:hypothetical protein
VLWLSRTRPGVLPSGDQSAEEADYPPPKAGLSTPRGCHIEARATCLLYQFEQVAIRQFLPGPDDRHTIEFQNGDLQNGEFGNQS